MVVGSNNELLGGGKIEEEGRRQKKGRRRAEATIRRPTKPLGDSISGHNTINRPIVSLHCVSPLRIKSNCSSCLLGLSSDQIEK